MTSWFPSLPAGPIWLRHAQIPTACLPDATFPTHGSASTEGLVSLDLRIADGVVTEIVPAGSAADGIDLEHSQVWPCFADVHVHLDKTQTWPRAANPDGTHLGARSTVAADMAHWTEEDIATRFTFGLECAYAHGTAAMRTHLDSYWPHAQIAWSVFRRLRDEWAGRISLQACSICPLDRFWGSDGDALADEVARSDGLLGMVTTGLGDPDRPMVAPLQDQIDRFFHLAEQRGLALDLHLDETGDPRACTLRMVAETALRRNFRKPIQVGHCCALALQDDDEAAETIRLCAEAGLTIVVLPMVNMYLQGRAPLRTPRWRGVTLVHEFHAAGVPVSFASDNCRDPFFAFGDYDMLEVYREAVRIGHLDHPFGHWAGAVTAIPAGVMGETAFGTIRRGGSADLVLFRGRGMTELLARPQADRIVLRAGRAIDTTLPDFRRLDRLLGQ